LHRQADALGALIAQEEVVMAQDPLFILAAVACLSVLAVLMFGIGTFGRGGDFNRKHANKIMRLRLLLQFIAVILIVLFVYVSRNGG
jgi:hypothetical protein